MIAIIDYGVGNLFSLQSSLKFIGAEAKVTNNIEEIKAADRIILPGVGAFADAARKLRESGLGDVVVEEAKKHVDEELEEKTYKSIADDVRNFVKAFKES